MAKKTTILDFFQNEAPSSSLTRREAIEVRKSLEEPASKRGKYKAWSPKDRAEIGKHASLHGNTTTARHFASKYPGLTRQTVNNFKNMYQKEKEKSQNKEVIYQVYTARVIF